MRLQSLANVVLLPILLVLGLIVLVTLLAFPLIVALPLLLIFSVVGCFYWLRAAIFGVAMPRDYWSSFRNTAPVLFENRPSFDDPVLGHLEFDTRCGWYVCKRPIHGADVELLIDLGPAGELEQNISRARKVIARIDELCRTATDFTVAELLSLKNDVFLEKGEKPISADEFRKQLELSSVTINLDGTTEVGFFSGCMFGDHAPSVQLDSEGIPVSAGVE